MMHQVPALKKGDTVGIVSPAGRINFKSLDFAVSQLEKSGLKVLIGKHAFNQYHQFAGKDKERISDFQNMLNDPEIKAIICSRGGYGSIRIVNALDFTEFIRTPKWIVGYSDISIFHVYLNQLLKTESLHAEMPIHFQKDKSGESMETMINCLMGKLPNYKIPPHKLNRNGTAKGEIIGGNLSILYSLRGTPMDVETRNKMLFIEDVGEELYHLDRMMNNLKAGGKLHELKALIVGGFSRMKAGDPDFGETAFEIINHAVADFSYPVVYDFPAGHLERNLALPFGKPLKLQVNENEVKINWKK